jgi:hypothetical protein
MMFDSPEPIEKIPLPVIQQSTPQTNSAPIPPPLPQVRQKIREEHAMFQFI